MGYITISLRAIINVESLSGVETVGNLSRHRTAPIVVPTQDGYTVRFLPVLSGESIAHAYQELLVEEALQRKLPLSNRSRRFEFLKFADEELLKEEGIVPPKNEKEIRKVEVEILLKDFVSDVGGFLYAGDYPVKRTSCFQVGYAIPAIREKEAAALESQFHVRFSPSQMDKQMPYSVEVGSAVYTFTFLLDVDRIGVPSTQFGDQDKSKEDELAKTREERVKAALSALTKFYSSLAFGAKRSRFLPNMEPISAVASYSTGFRFVVSPGNEKSFISSSRDRSRDLSETLKKLGVSGQVELFAFSKETSIEGVRSFSSIEEMMKALVERALSK